LGGDRKGTLRTYCNLMVVFLLCGLWHGADWVFVAWGLYHGFFLVLERLVCGKKDRVSVVRNRWNRVLPLLGHLYALLMVMCGWVLFRSESFEQAWGYYGVLLGHGRGSNAVKAIWIYSALDVQIALAVGILFSMPVLPTLNRWWHEKLTTWGASGHRMADVAWAGFETGRTILLLFLLVLCFLPLASGTHNPFIYFRF